ncbi:hypothetical protein LPW26_13885 [Rhodopseudomonas sp. HC1]|uniref:hypothetical protein n=1 Tax=Rhodopseudomonas infernalis TaxID=2897386 RepID=UPI001EE7E3F7|nr:hypothetical protein [Rhodopseudomonas infernalis]MCG6205738.1 hypothetical protein [Rhodopseudomonas infernalis]
MRTWIGAAVVAGAFGLLTPMMAQAMEAPHRTVTQLGQDRGATDFSARHRGRAHAQRSVHGHKYRSGHRYRRAARTAPAYGAQPYGYHPGGMAPFFPFGFGGYGFQPSW